MTDTFVPPIAPSPQGTQKGDKERLLSAAYGDGFKQDGPDGLNPVERTATLAWDPIQRTDANTIMAFLEAHIGVPFYYALPGELAPRSWICTSRSRTYPYPQQDALTIQLAERFIY